jgi:hypothetical protein
VCEELFEVAVEVLQGFEVAVDVPQGSEILVLAPKHFVVASLILPFLLFLLCPFLFSQVIVPRLEILCQRP